MKRTAGVTLIELLVAMTLLSFLSVGILFAMRIGLSTLERTNSRMATNRKSLGVERILSNQIAGFVPSKADCRRDAQSPAQRLPLFQGEMETMRFVSTYSMEEAWRGYPRILEFQVSPGENGRGVRLLVNELLYTGPLSAGSLCLGQMADPVTNRPRTLFVPVQVGPISFVLADKLAYCRFSYRLDRDFPQPPVWFPRWAEPRTPAAVRIDMAPLDADPAKIQIPSFTAPFRVNRDPAAQYGEFM